MSLRIWTRAAPRPSDRLTPVRLIAGVIARAEVSFMQAIRCPATWRVRARSYGTLVALVQLVALAFGAFPAGAQTGKAVQIVALGDSLTAGLGLQASSAFPAKLERTLKAKGQAVEITNAGVSGDTAAGGLGRLDWSVPDGTDAAIVELGANDMLRGFDPKVTQRALDAIRSEEHTSELQSPFGISY